MPDPICKTFPSPFALSPKFMGSLRFSFTDQNIYTLMEQADSSRHVWYTELVFQLGWFGKCRFKNGSGYGWIFHRIILVDSIDRCELLAKVAHVVVRPVGMARCQHM